VFGARVSGVDINRPLEEGAFAAIHAAFDEHLVLVFSGQPMTDHQQIAFSERFGPLDGTAAAGVNPGAGTPFARQSNLDINSGETISADDRRMFYQKANMYWHCDSAFKAIPFLCSVLTARIVPAQGGATEFASTRAAHFGLGAAEQAEIEDLSLSMILDIPAVWPVSPSSPANCRRWRPCVTAWCARTRPMA
jgi:alpha-ketoglutarate-dependent 2,4-dichlorophenoxyacetate dioxygenase